MNGSFGFDVAIYEQVRQSWLTAHESSDDDDPCSATPSLEDLAALIDVAFESSIRSYEGQHLRFSIALCDKDYQPSSSRKTFTGSAILPLTQVVPLDANTVTLLGAATDVHRSALLIAPSTATIPSHIWGMTFYLPGRQGNPEAPFALTTKASPNDMLLVTIVAPGSLLIARGEQPLGHVVFGQFTPTTPTPLKDRRSMGQYLLRVVEQTQGYREAGMEYWRLYTDVLDGLFRSMVAHGNGGSIVILPPDQCDDYLEHCVMGFRFDSELGIASIMRHAIGQGSLLPADNQWWISRVEYPALRERIAFLARLTAMDGAVLLTPDLEPIAIGVKLKAPQWQGNVRLGPDGAGNHGDVFDVHRFGTRHTSAVDFVGTCPDVVSFVVSQDGPVRGFMKANDQTVLCWPECADFASSH